MTAMNTRTKTKGAPMNNVASLTRMSNLVMQ